MMKDFPSSSSRLGQPQQMVNLCLKIVPEINHIIIAHTHARTYTHLIPIVLLDFITYSFPVSRCFG